jgi:hypothetical protein
MKVFGKVIDERFFRHRLRSTSIGGLAGAWLAAGLFLYRYYADHAVSWDLIAVVATMGAVKLAAMAWFYATE